MEENPKGITAKGRLLGSVMLTLLCGVGASPVVHAANSWLSKSMSVDGRSEPAIASSGIKAARLSSDSSMTLFDITISLHNAPAGDDDFTVADSSEQEKYEEVIKYFADAVCEQSNGANQLREVRFFKNKKHQSKSDIIWNASEWPRANPSGFGANGMHIYFGDVFPNGNGPGSDYDMLAHPKGAGYTLGHEWGHYAYGLFDEYKGTGTAVNSPQATDIPPSPSIMASQWQAIANGTKHLNHSTSNNFGSPARTAQGRVYGKSGWEVLLQDTKDDPKSGQKTAQPSRVRYTALSAVQPTSADNWVSEQLTSSTNSCRDNLKIIWVTGNLDMQVVIDRSGSMSGTPISNAKQAASLLVDAVTEGSTSLGVVSFNGSETQDSPIQSIPTPGQTVKQSVKSIISSISSGGGTAMFDAASYALDNLIAYQNTSVSGAPGVVFLLSDGGDTSSSTTLEDLVLKYQSENVPLFTFGYGSASPTGPLLKMADGTGGSYFSSPTLLSEITDAFLQANAVVSDSQNIVATNTTVAPGADSTTEFLVDTGIATVNLFFNFDGVIGDLDFSVVDAADAAVAGVVPECTPVGGSISCSVYLDEANITAGGYGTWHINAHNHTANDIEVAVNASATPSDLGSFNVNVAGTSGSSVEYPDPMIVTVATTKDYLVTGVNVSATITDPNGVVAPFQMYDDGTNGDAYSGDGIYSAILGYQENGIYQVEVTVDNLNQTASYTAKGLLTQTLDGSNPTPPALPASVEEFVRITKSSFVVSNIPYSDGNDYYYSAPALSANNEGLDSVIDSAGDVDFINLVNIDTSKELVVRVTDFSLGMEPLVNVFASDGTTPILEDLGLQDHISQTGYFYTVVPSASLEEGLYISVRHADSSATQGGYQVSAGEPLNTDVPPNLAPVAARDMDTVYVGQTVNIDVLANDSDGDGDQLMLDSVDASSTMGVISVDNGQVSYQPGDAFNSLAEGMTANDSFSYVVTDGKAYTLGSVDVVVRANTLPVAGNDQITVDSNDSVMIDVMANDSDVDGHSLQIVSVGGGNVVGAVSINDGRTITYDTAGNFDDLNKDEIATDTFVYEVADSLAGTSTASVTVTVVGANHLPIAESDFAEVEKSQTVAVDLLVNDSDVDGDTLSLVSLELANTTGIVQDNGDGTVSYDPNGQFNALYDGESATDSFSYTLSDGDDEVQGTVTITIMGEGDEPSNGGSSGGSSTPLMLLMGLGLLLFRRFNR